MDENRLDESWAHDIIVAETFESLIQEIKLSDTYTLPLFPTYAVLLSDHPWSTTFLITLVHHSYGQRTSRNALLSILATCFHPDHASHLVVSVDSGPNAVKKTLQLEFRNRVDDLIVSFQDIGTAWKDVQCAHQNGGDSNR